MTKTTAAKRTMRNRAVTGAADISTAEMSVAAASTTSPPNGGVPATDGTASVHPASIGGADTASATTTPAPLRKTVLVRQMLDAKGGVSLAVLCVATGWQAHSVRAVLSGIRKAGTPVERLPKAEGETSPRYRLLPAEAGSQ